MTMKNSTIFFALALLTMATSASADTVTCSGTASGSSEFVSGNCAGESCTGYSPDQTVTASGTCDSGVTFDVTDMLQGSFLDLQCMGSMLMGSAPVESVSLSGTCSNGGQFSGSAFMNGGSVSGSCQLNGFFNATIMGSEGSVSGQCTTP
jgi:hypothetical protein